jgi:hypothetical protein
VTTTTALIGSDTDALDAIHQAEQNIDHSHDAKRSTTLLLMNEALSRVRMRMERKQRWPAGKRPAREVAMLAAKRRELY